jgi:hypothetical protein
MTTTTILSGWVGAAAVGFGVCEDAVSTGEVGDVEVVVDVELHATARTSSVSARAGVRRVI